MPSGECEHANRDNYNSAWFVPWRRLYTKSSGRPQGEYVHLHSPMCFWAWDQPHSDILQMMLIKTTGCCRYKQMMLHCRILNGLIAKGMLVGHCRFGNSVQALLCWLFGCFSRPCPVFSWLCVVSLYCFSLLPELTPILLSSFSTKIDKAVHLISYSLYHHFISVFSTQVRTTLGGPVYSLPFQ